MKKKFSKGEKSGGIFRRFYSICHCLKSSVLPDNVVTLYLTVQKWNIFWCDLLYIERDIGPLAVIFRVSISWNVRSIFPNQCVSMQNKAKYESTLHWCLTWRIRLVNLLFWSLLDRIFYGPERSKCRSSFVSFLKVVCSVYTSGGWKWKNRPFCLISSQRKKRLCFRVICKCQICIFGGLEEKLDDFEDLCTIKRQTLEEINEEWKIGRDQKNCARNLQVYPLLFEMRFCCRDAMRVYSTFCARVKFFLERTLEAPGVWRLQCHWYNNKNDIENQHETTHGFGHLPLEK